MAENNLVALDDPDRLAELKADLVSDRLWNGEPAVWFDAYAHQAVTGLDRRVGNGLLVDVATLELYDPQMGETVKGESLLPETTARLLQDDTASPYYRPPTF